MPRGNFYRPESFISPASEYGLLRSATPDRTMFLPSEETNNVVGFTLWLYGDVIHRLLENLLRDSPIVWLHGYMVT